MDKEIIYLEKCLTILSIFTKATTKLQAEKYPIIYYLILEIYNIYNKLKRLKEDFNQVNISIYKF